MKIKIPPYPNYKLSQSLSSQIEDETFTNSSDETGIKSNQLSFFMKFASGNMRMINSRPVEHNGKKYVTAFPNPVHLFLSQGVENYNLSEKIKYTNFPRCGQEMDGPTGETIHFLEIEEDGTHTCYNNYMQYRISSVIMLVAALEAFINHIIPNDFIYRTTKKNKELLYSKNDIESTKISFWEKLIKVIPQYLKNDTFWDMHLEDRKNILALYDHRTQVIHLKTNSQAGFKLYLESIDKLLDCDLKSAINSTINFMNIIQPNFVVTEAD